MGRSFRATTRSAQFARPPRVERSVRLSAGFTVRSPAASSALVRDAFRRAPDVLEQERVVEVGQLDVAQARPHAERHPDERGAQDIIGGLSIREVEREREGADHLGQRRPSHGARIR
jgi:hypothetical protein